ncbi:MAG: lysine transporter LysE [Bacteroidetes bacterium HGW-Bacteroidetes-2]|jgi:threonine/homoserine/homoserine lactone efflux protein|nr:MAG: lysine transporter LysE [Bacteroidetes bacterium HGW-Bacteroidetes-2]
MFEILLSFSIATMALALSPGPDNVFVFTQSITNGSSYGIATTAGLISGCIVHTTLVAFGISAIIMASEGLFLGIKIAGAIYLLYLAFQVYKAGNTLMITSKEIVQKSHFQLYKQGVIMNILNPKVTIFFLAFFPAFLWDKEENTIAQFYILGLLFMGISFLIFSAIALLSGRISTFLQQKKNSGVFFKWLQIIVFTGIAIFLFLP